MTNTTHMAAMTAGTPNESASTLKSKPRTNTLEKFQSFLSNALAGQMAPIPTGCTALDDHLNGGLRNELYILMAEPGAGKTTLCMSMFPRFAAEGRDVLFISLDMSKDQVLGKIASRLSYDLSNGKPPLGFYDVTGLADTDYADDLIAAYAYEADYTTIYDRNDIKSWDDITIAIMENGLNSEEPPVVIIDYLQVMAAMQESATERDAVDKALNFCRDLIAKFCTPIILVSSISRTAYGKKLSLSSCKESGSIEYAADCVMGLERNSDSKESPGSDMRQVKLKIFKSRFSGSMVEHNLYMMPKYNLFLMDSSVTEAAGVSTSSSDEDDDDEYEPI